MASTVFIDQETLIASSWLNDVNAYVYNNTLIPTNFYNVLTDGADNTGVIDATTIINARITALSASGGGQLLFPAGTYLVLDIELKSNVELVPIGKVTFIKNGGLDETHILRAIGQTGSSTLLTANCAVHALSCAVTSVTGLTEGGWAILRTAEYISGSAGRKQEVLQIIDITGLTVTFQRPVIDTYNTANTAELIPLTPIENVKVNGFHFTIPPVAGGNVGGIFDFQYVVNSTISNNKCIGPGGDAAVRLKTCFNTHVIGNLVQDGQNIGASGFGYGIEFDEATHFCTAVRNTTIAVRENTFTNRTRHCAFLDNIVLNSNDSGFNTHGSGNSHILIRGNRIVGTIAGSGIAVGFGSHTAGDSFIDIVDNVVKNTAASGITVNAPIALQNQYITVKGNVLNNIGVTSPSSTGILIQYSDYVDVQSNMIYGNTTNISNGIYVLTSVQTNILNNNIQDITNGFGITLSDTTRAYVKFNKLLNISSSNVRVLGANSNCFVESNIADDTTITVTGTGFTMADNAWDNFYGSVTYDPGSLADGAGVTTTVTVSGASLGDFVNISFSLALQGILLTAWVSAANTVSVRFQNETAGVLDLASGTLLAKTKTIRRA